MFLSALQRLFYFRQSLSLRYWVKWDNQVKWLSILISILVLACDNTPKPAEVRTSPPPQKLVQTDITILFLGDSLTEGYDLDPTQSYPAQIKKHFNNSGQDVTIINAGISGDTTLGGLNRFQWYLEHKTYAIDILFLALGANDGLRGLSIEHTTQNLRTLLTLTQAAKIKVILAGMRLPPNYGKTYEHDFNTLYDVLEQEFNLTRMDFLLADVAGEASLNLDDGIHPNAQGYEIIAANAFKIIQPVVTSIIASR